MVYKNHCGTISLSGRCSLELPIQTRCWRLQLVHWNHLAWLDSNSNLRFELAGGLVFAMVALLLSYKGTRCTLESNNPPVVTVSPLALPLLELLQTSDGKANNGFEAVPPLVSLRSPRRLVLRFWLIALQCLQSRPENLIHCLGPWWHCLLFVWPLCSRLATFASSKLSDIGRILTHCLIIVVDYVGIETDRIWFSALSIHHGLADPKGLISRRQPNGCYIGEWVKEHSSLGRVFVPVKDHLIIISGLPSPFGVPSVAPGDLAPMLGRQQSAGRSRS